MLQAIGHGENGGAPLKIDKIALLALGANLTSTVGAPEKTIKNALETLEKHNVVIRAVSSFYLTPAFPVGAGPDYVNAAACVDFGGNAQALLTLLHEIEAQMGRDRAQRWGQRTLDIDLLAFGDQVAPDAGTFLDWRDLPIEVQKTHAPQELILPHPRIQDRAFVLVPLADVAPEWRHPVLKMSVIEMLAALPAEDIAAIRRIE